VAARYRDGFSECAQEVDRFLASVSGLGHDTRYRLMNHLATCIKHPPPARRTHVHPPPAFGAPALNPGIYGVQLPPSSAASSTIGRVDLTSESTTVPDVNIASSIDGRRRSVSAAAAPYNSAVFPGFVVPPSMTGRLSACTLFPVVAGDDRQSVATISGELSSFRPIQSPITGDRCSPTDSDELDAEMTRCDAGSDVDEDANARPGLVTSSSSSCGGRPLTEKNDNNDNIARRFLDAQNREASGPDASAAAAAAAATVDQSMMMFVMAMHNDVKDEHVWRPW